MPAPRSFAVVLLTCLLSIPAALPAQETGAKPAVAPRPSAPSLSFEFDGGTFGELCSLLTGLGNSARGVNIVIEPEAALARLPSFTVQDANVQQVLEAACATASGQGQSVQVKELRGPGNSVFAITARTNQQAGGPAAGQEVTQVHSLGALLQEGKDGPGFAPETILSAVDAATTEQPLRALRYHADSRLLIARGSKDSLAVVAQVLRELDDDVSRRRKQATAAAKVAGESAPGAEKPQPK
jgi:hypothetical protein